MIAVLIGFGWALAVVAFLTVAVCVCKAAAMGDDIARRALGPGSPSSTDLQLGVMVALDEAGGPPAERRRQP